MDFLFEVEDELDFNDVESPVNKKVSINSKRANPHNSRRHRISPREEGEDFSDDDVDNQPPLDYYRHEHRHIDREEGEASSEDDRRYDLNKLIQSGSVSTLEDVNVQKQNADKNVSLKKSKDSSKHSSDSYYSESKRSRLKNKKSKRDRKDRDSDSKVKSSSTKRGLDDEEQSRAQKKDIDRYVDRNVVNDENERDENEVNDDNDDDIKWEPVHKMNKLIPVTSTSTSLTAVNTGNNAKNRVHSPKIPTTSAGLTNMNYSDTESSSSSNSAPDQNSDRFHSRKATHRAPGHRLERDDKYRRYHRESAPPPEDSLRAKQQHNNSKSQQPFKTLPSKDEPLQPNVPVISEKQEKTSKDKDKSKSKHSSISSSRKNVDDSKGSSSSKTSHSKQSKKSKSKTSSNSSKTGSVQNTSNPTGNNSGGASGGNSAQFTSASATGDVNARHQQQHHHQFSPLLDRTDFSPDTVAADVDSLDGRSNHNRVTTNRPTSLLDSKFQPGTTKETTTTFQLTNQAIQQHILSRFDSTSSSNQTSPSNKSLSLSPLPSDKESRNLKLNHAHLKSRNGDDDDDDDVEDDGDDDDDDNFNSKSKKAHHDGISPNDGAMNDDSDAENDHDKRMNASSKNNVHIPDKPFYYPSLQGCRSVEEFECLNRIEEGTYGVVYRARDKKVNEIVALKRLKMEKERDGFPITSLREINTLMKAQHENIVTVREIVVGSNMDKIYLVMDYVEHDLKSLMEIMNGPFSVGEVKSLLVQLLRAVNHLHDNWILHRDLKTSNLLLSHQGILKVGDFGLAREYGSPLKHYTEVVVTLWYRAPELLLGCKQYTCPIDLWSVGCIFAEFLLQRPLFPGKGEVDELNIIFRDLGTPTERIWPGVSQLPGLKKCVFADYPYNQLRRRFTEKQISDHGFDLLNSFLTYNPDKRITAEKALLHPYFNERPRAIHPSMFPSWPAKSEGAVHRKASPRPPAGGGALAAAAAAVVAAANAVSSTGQVLGNSNRVRYQPPAPPMGGQRFYSTMSDSRPSTANRSKTAKLGSGENIPNSSDQGFLLRF